MCNNCLGCTLDWECAVHDSYIEDSKLVSDCELCPECSHCTQLHQYDALDKGIPDGS